MGYNISGVAFKSDISNEIEMIGDAFKADLEFKHESPLSNQMSFVPNDNEVVIFSNNGASLIIYDGFGYNNPAESLLNISDDDGMAYVASETAMSFILTHKRNGKILIDYIDYENDFHVHGPNVLSLTDDDDVVWDGIFDNVRYWLDINDNEDQLLSKTYILKPRKAEKSKPKRLKSHEQYSNNDLIVAYYQLVSGHFDTTKVQNPESILNMLTKELEARDLALEGLYKHHTSAESYKNRLNGKTKAQLDRIIAGIKDRMNQGILKNPSDLIALRVIAEVRPNAPDEIKKEQKDNSKLWNYIFITMAILVLVYIALYISKNY